MSPTLASVVVRLVVFGAASAGGEETTSLGVDLNSATASKAWVLPRPKGVAFRAGELVLAADTLVVLDGRILGKPAGPSEAQEMLGRLAGRDHLVHTGVAVRDGDSSDEAAAVETTRVTISVSISLPMGPPATWARCCESRIA